MSPLPDARFAVVAAVLLVGLAIAFWVFSPLFEGRAAAKRYVGSHRLALGSVVVVFLLNAIITLPLASVVRSPGGLTLPTFLIAALSTEIPMLLVVYFRLVAPGVMTWEDMGLKLLPLEQVVRVGTLTGLGGLGITIALDAGLSQIGLKQNQLDQFRFIRGASLPSFLLVLLVAVIFAPCVEELFFRGFLFGTYREHKPMWIAYGASSLIFALLHLDPNVMNPSQMAALAVGIFSLGVLLAWTYQRTGSLFPGILAHALNNAVGLIAFYALGAS
ncbi:MAG: CPBP family intramembrane metalloprotease [Chloroflexi bacterium]|nr:CPBP family intramembrane metalloprotease [Chloroflexota bacterium]